MRPQAHCLREQHTHIERAADLDNLGGIVLDFGMGKVEAIAKLKDFLSQKVITGEKD